MEKRRCAWVAQDDLLYQKYHDEEWGVPWKDERALFELLTLEGMQAGLSWRMILGRREEMRQAFHQFDPYRCAVLTDAELAAIMEMPGVIRHRKKVEMVRRNARAFLTFEGGFSDWIWSFVDHMPIISGQERLCETPLSHAIAQELKKRGFTFVGPKIVYSFMQAAGLVNDHEATCAYKQRLVFCP